MSRPWLVAQLWGQGLYTIAPWIWCIKCTWKDLLTTPVCNRSRMLKVCLRAIFFEDGAMAWWIVRGFQSARQINAIGLSLGAYTCPSGFFPWIYSPFLLSSTIIMNILGVKQYWIWLNGNLLSLTNGLSVKRIFFAIGTVTATVSWDSWFKAAQHSWNIFCHMYITRIQ